MRTGSSGRGPAGLRHALRAATVLLVAVSLALAGGGVAHATGESWTATHNFAVLGDGFEHGPGNPPGSRWSFQREGSGSGSFVTGEAAPLSGETSVRLHVPRAGGWVGVGRTVTPLSIGGRYPYSCVVDVYFKVPPGLNAPATVNIEAIDPGTWRYRDLAQVKVATTETYWQWYGSRIKLGQISQTGPTPVHVRFSLIANEVELSRVFVDAMSVHCYYE